MLVVSQANDDAQVRDSILKQYLARVRQLMLNFDEVEFHHVPRLHNDWADILRKPGLNRTVIQGILS